MQDNLRKPAPNSPKSSMHLLGRKIDEVRIQRQSTEKYQKINVQNFVFWKIWYRCFWSAVLNASALHLRLPIQYKMFRRICTFIALRLLFVGVSFQRKLRELDSTVVPCYYYPTPAVAFVSGQFLRENENSSSVNKCTGTVSFKAGSKSSKWAEL